MLSSDYHAAARLTQRHPLKAYDAIQLACARKTCHTDFPRPFWAGKYSTRPALRFEPESGQN